MDRLLCILSGMNAGGAETFLMKLYRQIDRTKYQFDFCVNSYEKNYYEEEIASLGGRIFRIPSKSESLKQFKKQLFDLIKNEDYKFVLRITSNAMGFMEAKIAKKAGAKICAIRSSNSSDGGSFKNYIAHRFGKLLYNRYIDVRIAPSDLAAKYTFGKKNYTSGKTRILRNGLDLDSYKYSSLAREKIRKEFNISQNDIVIGHIGRFMEQKNHKFLLEVFAEILNKNSESKLVLVGNGILELQIKKLAEQLGILKSIVFAGVRSDIPDILSAMDVMVMPSLYEGMPNTVIEAQATGLPCLISDTITREADITGLVDYMPITNPKAWAEKTLSKVSCYRKDTRKDFIANGYSIESITDNFIKSIFGDEI